MQLCKVIPYKTFEKSSTFSWLFKKAGGKTFDNELKISERNRNFSLSNSFQITENAFCHNWNEGWFYEEWGDSAI